MWTRFLTAAALSVAVLVLGGGCSRKSTEDRASITPSREVNQTRTTGSDGKLSSVVNLPAEGVGDGRISTIERTGPEDADAPASSSQPASASVNNTRLADGLPFSPAPKGLTHEETRELDRMGDQDDPEAPVISVEPSPVAQQIAMLNNGRGDTAASPTRTAARTAPTESSERAGPAAADSPHAEPMRSDPAGPARSDQVSSPPASAAEVTDTQPTLSTEFESLDNDSDGQIGLYEWPREKLADFQRLDTNQDGFLTPTELTSK
jgi:hypothetical protein